MNERYKNCPGYPERQWFSCRDTANNVRQKGERIRYVPGCGYYIVKSKLYVR